MLGLGIIWQIASASLPPLLLDLTKIFTNLMAKDWHCVQPVMRTAACSCR